MWVGRFTDSPYRFLLVYHRNAIITVKRIIIQAEVLGFCSGVKLAMGKALKARSDFPHRRIFTFGELIHNNEAICLLEKKHIYALAKEKSLAVTNDYSDAIIIVCAHGIEHTTLKQLQKNFFRVIDATCPHVLQSQKKAEKAVKQGTLFLIGEKNHQEVLSIKSHAELVHGGTCTVIENENEARNFVPDKTSQSFYVIGQTTLKQTEYQAIIDILADKISQCDSASAAKTATFIVYNTICPATQKRQAALLELTKHCEAILVIGGKNSANTKRLFQSAREHTKNAFLIENAAEIPSEIYRFERIGITAGASTPDFVIDEIDKKLRES